MWLAVVIGLLLRQRTLVFFGAVVLSTDALSRLWIEQNMKALVYRRHLSHRRVWPHEEVVLTIEFENHGLWPIAFLECHDSVPDKLEFSRGTLLPHHFSGRKSLYNPLRLKWFERVRRQFPLRCGERGRYVFGQVALSVTDAMGLHRLDATGDSTAELLVYPRLCHMEEIFSPYAYPQGERSLQSFLFDDPLRITGLREYRPGDPLRQFDWKATARTNKPMVRVHEASAHLDLLLVLNVATYDLAWEGIDSSLVEWSISATATLGLVALDAGCRIGLLANDSFKSTLAIGGGPEQGTMFLDLLAGLHSHVQRKGRDLLQQAANERPFGATLLFVTPQLNEPILELATELRNRGVALKVLFTGSGELPFEANWIARTGRVVHAATV